MKTHHLDVMFKATFQARTFNESLIRIKVMLILNGNKYAVIFQFTVKPFNKMLNTLLHFYFFKNV